MEGLGSGAGSSGLGFTVLLGLWSLGTPCGAKGSANWCSGLRP